MNLSTLLISLTLFFLSTIVYIYYTCWVYLEPFLGENSPYKHYFPLPNCIKFILPAMVVIVVLCAGSFLVSYANKLKNKKKATPTSHAKKE